MMKLSIRKLTLLFILALVVVCTNAAIFYGNTVDLIHSQKAVTSSHEVIAQLENFRSHFQDAEIAQGKYLITADIKDFQAYTKAKQNTQSSLEELSSLTKNYPHKQEWLFVFKQKINQYLELLQAEVELRKNRGIQAVIQSLKSPEHQQERQETQTWLGNYLTEEQNLLQQRIQRSQICFRKTIKLRPFAM